MPQNAGVESGFTAECEPEKYLRFAINSAIILPYIYGEAGLLSLKITEGGLDDVKRKCDTCCWLGLAWLGLAYSAVFSVRQVLIYIIYNKPATEAGRIMPWLRFFAFTGKAVV